MFRLHRSKGSKSGERIDFRFSNFQANQVPKGWDKLFVSIISLETGKTVAKSSKALVRNGSCMWRETLTESVWIGLDHSSNELEDCWFKFVVAMGSARSGILGEATVNVTGYMDSATPVPLSLPLKKCSHGTTLQINLQCSAPRNKSRGGGEDASSHSGDVNADIDAKSDGSQGSFARSFGSSSGKDPDCNLRPEETPSRGTSFSASDSRRSSFSADGSTGRGTFSPGNIMNGDKYNPEARQDSTGLPSITANGFVEDSSRSNYSGLDSKDRISEFGQIALLKNVGSSKSILEAAETTIDEIRSEAKMWERNARKLMLDLDILKKEFSDQSSSKANLELELSAAHTESDGLKKEIKQLELSLEEMKSRQKAPEYHTSRSHIEKGLEDEIKFNRESNSELALQLKKAQESNIELVSILQELEETIETQKVEIQELSALKTKFSSTDCSIDDGFQESKTLTAQLHILEESERLLLLKVQSLEQSLKEKTSELENERSLRNQLQRAESENKRKLSDKDNEILNLEAKLSVSLEKRHAEEIMQVDRGSTDLIIELENLKEKIQELERDCTELTDENLELLFKLKKFQNSFGKEGNLHEHSSREHSSRSYISSGSEAGETEVHNTEAETENKLAKGAELEVLEASKICSEILKQLQTAFSFVNNPLQNIQKSEYDIYVGITDNQVGLEDEASCKEKADLILLRMTDFNKALSASTADWSSVVKVKEDEIRKKDDQILEARKELEASIEKVHELSLTVLETANLRAQLEEKNIENIEQQSWIAKLEASLHSMEGANEVLVHRLNELEALSDKLKEEKALVQEQYEAVSTGTITSSNCLNDLQNELLAVNSSSDSHVSAYKILEKKMAELETGKRDQELHLSELERENVQLSERISGLEAQLRYLTNEKESTCMELENSQRFVSTLQEQLFNVGSEMERKLSDQKEKMEEMQKKLLENQEEIEYLNAANSKLQTTAENVMEECDSLQRSNAKLRSQKLELYEQCTRLEAELREMREKFSSYSESVDSLENNLSLMQEGFAMTENRLTSELESLLEEHGQHKEQLVFGESLLNQLYEDKTLEAERLQKEVNRLTQQIYSTHDEREKMASDAVQEVSRLSEDKAKLESVLQEVQSKNNQLEDELKNIKTESKMKMESLMVEIAALKQGDELMKADSDKMTKLVEKCKSSEDRLKTSVNNLELKLTVLEYERQQLLEESAGLKIRVEKMENLKDEIASLKSVLSTAKLEKDKLESALQLVSDDCDIQKADKILLTARVSSLEKIASAYEDCKRNKFLLEEKLLRLEGDLMAKEATCAQDIELKNELSGIKRENRQLQRKIKQLEEENVEFLKKYQTVDEELKLLKETDQVQILKKETVSGTEQQRLSRRKVSFNVTQGQEHSRVGQITNDNKDQAENEDKYHEEVGSDSLSRIQALENDLADALETNQLYSLQLKRLSEGNNRTMTRSKSSLEAELRDIQERYFHMSLKYAEVEAQREELVMKLKAARTGKKWF
uniref:C2 NT-type domain-containing protein n=1 Tax=Kalanchoe fedtschenkoi TaxID=63787 RepID=A0A7N0UAN2_KALFE